MPHSNDEQAAAGDLLAAALDFASAGSAFGVRLTLSVRSAAPAEGSRTSSTEWLRRTTARLLQKASHIG